MDALTGADPATVGPFTLRGRLGAGGMGRVYLAQDAHGAQVAVKVIRSDLADDPQFRVRFRHEVEAASRVPGHVTAAVVDADTEAVRPWVATRYVPGPSLAHRVRAEGPLRPRALRALARGLLEALVVVHDAGLVHRDLKPSNILLAADRPRIIDFGIARAADATRLTLTGHLVGTPAYMSPEQAVGGRDPGPASDVFSMGSVLVFAATGTAPFSAPSTPAVLFRLLHADADLGTTPEPVRRVVARCLARDPADRPPARELLGMLGARRRRTALAGSAGGVVAAGAVTAALLVLPGRGTGPGVPDPAVADPAVATSAAPVPVVAPARPATTVSATVPLGHRAGRVAAAPDRLYVTDLDTGAITVLDRAGAPVGRVDVGRFPSALALSPQADRLYVTLNTTPTRVLAVDTATLQVTGRTDIASGASDARIVRDADLAVSPDGTTVDVLDPRSLRLVALDAATLGVRAERTLGGDPTAVVASPDGTRLYVAAGETFTAGSLTVLDAAKLAPLATFPSGPAPADVAVSTDGRTVFVANTDPAEDPDASAVWVLDAATGTRTARLSDLVAPDRLLAGPGGAWLYVSLLGDPVLAAVDVRDLRPAGRVPMPAGVDDLAASPDGRTLYAVAGATLTVLTPAG